MRDENMEGNLLQVLNPQRLRSLEEWLQKTSITLTQVNGQRKYGGPPPDWHGSVPGPGCEVFISQIPRDIYEDILIPLFQRVAPLYEFRLMMNFSGQNRGFAFAKYGDPRSAAAAVRSLHMFQIQVNIRLMVRKSIEKRQLFLSELPPDLDRAILLTMLQMVTDGVEQVTARHSGSKARTITALVHYSSHYTASMAKKILVQAFKKQYGISMSVRWMSSNMKMKHEELHQERVPPPPPGLKPLAQCCPSPRFPLSQPTLADPLPPPPTLPFPRPPHSHPFSRVVGGPAPQVWNKMLLQALQSSNEPAGSAAECQLQQLCELHGLRVTLYEVRHHHTSPDGFLHFTYRLGLSGRPAPLSGAVQILPGPCSRAMEAEIHRTVAQQVIQTLCQ